MSGGAAVGVAAFDFDGTLVAGDSFTLFLARLFGWGRFATTLVTSLTSVFMANGYRVDRDASKADLIARLLSGYPTERLHSEGEEFGRRLATRIRPAMQARVEWHRSQGHRLLLVSASPEAYLVPFGRHLGFDAVLATRLETVTGGSLSGRLSGPNCRGPEKEARVRRWLAAEVGEGAVEMWAYGDSAGDRDLLAMADHAHLVSRRGRLKPVEGGRS